MDHPVTIGADRTKILDRINLIVFAPHRKRDEMMHLDISFPKFSVAILEY